MNRYKETVHEEIETRTPLDILVDLERMTNEITKGTSGAEGNVDVN
jgi:type I restriction enzyme M protein